MAVSYTHMTKVVTRLAELGIVDARRGRGGGLAITELGRTASVGWLVRRLEGDDEVVQCDGANPVSAAVELPTADAPAPGPDAFYTALDDITIAELAAPPTRNVLLALPRLAHDTEVRARTIGG